MIFREKTLLALNRFFRKFYALDIACFFLTYLIVISNPVRENVSADDITHTAITLSALLWAVYLSMPLRKKRNAVFSFLLMFFFSCVTVTALCMFFFDRYSNAWRSLMTVHAIAGLQLFGPFFMVYYFRHIYEKRFTKDARGELFSHSVFTVFRAGFWSGIIAGFAIGPHAMIPLHKWAMLFAVPLVLSHAGIATVHLLRSPAKTHSFLPRLTAGLLISLFLSLLLIAALYKYKNLPFLSQNDFIARGNPDPVKTGVSFMPSNVITPGGAVYRAELLGNSKASCGEFGCHEVMYKEWRESPHRYSANIFYEKALELAMKKGGVPVARLCAGCHDPISLLSGTISEAKPISDISREEGISCMVCHSITPHKNIIQNGSYTFSLPARFFKLVQNRHTVHDLRDEHLGDFIKDVYKTPEYCGSCHRVILPKEATGAAENIIEQDTYTSWKEGPYNNPHHPAFRKDKKQSCADCHMPRVTQQDRPVPLSPAHRFAAANSSLPYFYHNPKQLNAVQSFLQKNVLRVKIENVQRDRVNGRVTVSVENTGAGHVFPAGPLDINEVWIEVTVEDAEDRVIYRSGFIDKRHYVDERARFFQALETDKDGNEIKTHDLLSIVKRKVVRVLPPKEKITEMYVFPLEKTKGEFHVTARVNYRKLNQAFTDWVFGKGKVSFPVITVAEDKKNITL